MKPQVSTKFPVELNLPLTALVLLYMIVTSCNPTAGIDGPVAPSPERVDIVMEGAVDLSLHLEEENGLVFSYGQHEPLMRESEKAIRVAVDPYHYLEFILFNNQQADPFAVTGTYSAYPLQQMEDKSSYVVVHYINQAGKVLYTTSLNYFSALPQLQVFAIRETTATGFSARIRDLTLYEVTATNRLAGSAASESRILVNGTFVAVY